MSSVIRVENLGKRYLLSHQSERQPYLALRDVIADGVRKLGRRLAGRQSEASLQEEFWALREVSFEVNQGDRVGIIGRNGAGKSTLLKILSRITEPTTGRVTIRGRVASLLEVGTGFHPELTGRENIFLNGAILGMSRSEIKRKFDEIVDFAEIEKFLDTPVKRYSSGMYVRLAFAVAAHLEPEILFVDEVLAVGDSLFQKKCVDKMYDIAEKGHTVIFVSHNMGLISKLCNNAILLSNGSIIKSGAVPNIVNSYLENLSVSNIKQNISLADNFPTDIKPFVFTGVEISVNDNVTKAILSGSRCEIKLYYSSLQISKYLRFGIHVTDVNGANICIISPNQQLPEFVNSLGGCGSIVCAVPQLFLLPGKYYLNIEYSDANDHSATRLDRVYEFDVVEADVYGTGVIPNAIHGLVFMKADWHFS